MFDTLEPAAPDAILGLAEAFRADPNPAKINLTVGVYKDASGQTPVLETVREAEARMLEKASSKSYLPIDGSPAYAEAVRGLMFEGQPEILSAKRAVSAHTPGGTAALRVAAEFLSTKLERDRIWVSDPTWPNHPGIFKAAGLEVLSYPYFDVGANALRFDDMLEALDGIGEGDVVLLHGCCHNPTGVDPDPDQWAAIAKEIVKRRALPLVDFAYHGFGDGLAEDAAGLYAICAKNPEAVVCSSFSKNFGLYSERVGALTIVGESEDSAMKAMGHIKSCIRTNYSNPPMHGADIVTTILGDADLRARWEVELAGMRERINGTRKLFVDTLHAKGVARDFSFIAQQRGMFSFSGLTPEQVDRLREEYAIYVVRNGRINVAGITKDNVGTLCDAIAAVL